MKLMETPKETLSLVSTLIILIGSALGVRAQEISVIELQAPIVTLGGPSSGSILSFPFQHVYGNKDTLYVLDNREAAVIAFSSEGSELFRFGRTGAGPGEFQQAAAIAFGEGSVFISDRSLMRVVRYHSNGEYQDTIKLNYLPDSGLAVIDGKLFVSSNSSEVIVFRVNLLDPLQQQAVLTASHPDLVDMMNQVGQQRAGGLVAASQNSILIGLSGYGLYGIIHPNVEENQFQVRTINSAVVIEHIDEFVRNQREANSQGQQIGMRMLNSVNWISDELIAVEVRGDGRSQTPARLLIVEHQSGNEVGPRILFSSMMRAFCQISPDGRISVSNLGDASIEIFTWR